VIMFCIAFVALLALLATAAPLTEPCDYVDSEFYLGDLELVKECFDTYTVPQEFTDSIILALETAGDIYPYVDIAKNPPSPTPGYFNTVDYNKELEQLKKDFVSYNGSLKEIAKSTRKFIAQFHDSHFILLYGTGTKTKNIFAAVSAVTPFSWDLQNDDDKKASVHLSTTQFTAALGEDVFKLISSKAQNNTAVKDVDGKDPYDFFYNLFGEYNDMKSYQGKLQYTKFASANGFSILEAPLDDDILFNNHTVTFVDGDSFVFSFVIVNQKNPAPSRDMIDLGLKPSPRSFVTFDQEIEARRILENYEPKIISQNRLRDNKFIPCGTVGEMNFMVVSTFSVGNQYVEQFVDEMASCVASFEKNDFPISVVMAMNGGGLIVLSQLLQDFLMPNTDERFLVAARKTDSNKELLVTYQAMSEMANMDNGCAKFKTDSEIEKAYEITETDKFGNVEHKRTKKYFLASTNTIKAYMSKFMKKARKPTDIIVATDGYCFSACSIFTNNVIRQGAAIVTGYGSTTPGDTQFVAAQCPSSVIQPVQIFDRLKNISEHGIDIRVTFAESYNISTDMKETIPGDYDVLRIDKHLKFYNSFPSESDYPLFIAALKNTHEEFKTKCNPLNKRLLLVDNCAVSDPNALTTGHPCSAEGTWDNSTCLISTCKPGYSVDFDNNKCVKNICDYRYVKPVSSSHASTTSTTSGKSSASTVYPIMSIVFIIMTILAFII